MKVGERKFTFDDLALAYELHCNGCDWDFIEQAMGEGIKRSVEHVKSVGIKRP
jgi:hypothetical protein